MHGNSYDYICIAGKNLCAINFLKFLLKKIPKKKIIACPNKNDKGKDSWQPSFKKFAKNNNIKIVKLENLYEIRNLIFISIEFEYLINTKLFRSKKLFNFHFSLLPKYRGCHTNFYQVFNGEKYSGVTLHKIDNGIDTGPIGAKIRFKINPRDTAKDNYLKLMKYSVKLFKNKFKNLLNNNIIFKKQNLQKGSYFSRKTINYSKIKYIDKINDDLRTYNKIRSLIFPPLQYPVYKGKEIVSVKYKNKKISYICK